MRQDALSNIIHNTVDCVQYKSVSNQLHVLGVGNTNNACVTHTLPQSDAHLKDPVTIICHLQCEIQYHKKLWRPGNGPPFNYVTTSAIVEVLSSTMTNLNRNKVRTQLYVKKM